MAKAKEIKGAIKANKKQFSKDKKIKEFEQSIRKFHGLVECGMLRPRGYNIESIENQINGETLKIEF